VSADGIATAERSSRGGPLSFADAIEAGDPLALKALLAPTVVLVDAKAKLSGATDVMRWWDGPLRGEPEAFVRSIALPGEPVRVTVQHIDSVSSKEIETSLDVTLNVTVQRLGRSRGAVESTSFAFTLSTTNA
jgi:hypothetical protein